MNKIYLHYRALVVILYVLFYIIFGKKDPQNFYEKARQMIFPLGQFLVEGKEKFQMIEKENKNGRGCVIMTNHYCGGLDVCLIERFIECYIIVKNDICGEIVNEEDDGIQNFLKRNFFDKCLLIPYKRGNKESGFEVKRIIERETQKGKNVLIFPEGTSQRCWNKPLPFRKGIFDLCFEKQIPIFSISLNYSKDIGAGKKDTTHFPTIFGLSPHVKMFCNGIFYPQHYIDSMDLMNEVYQSISDHVYLEWNPEWEI